MAPNDVVNREDSAYTGSSPRSAPTRRAAPRWRPCSRRRCGGAPRWSPGTKPGRREQPHVRRDHRHRRPGVRVHRAGHARGRSGSTATQADCPTVPAATASDRRDLRLPRQGRRLRTFYTDQGIEPVRRRTTTRPAPSSAGRQPSFRTCAGCCATRACTRRARTCPRELADAVRPAGDARHRPLGEATTAAGCCSSTARTTRGAPSRSGSAAGTRDSLWYEAAGANHGANIAGLAAPQAATATAAVQRWAGRSRAGRRTGGGTARGGPGRADAGDAAPAPVAGFQTTAPEGCLPTRAAGDRCESACGSAYVDGREEH